MKKHFGWMTKPVTWGAVVISTLVSVVLGLLEIGWMFGLHKKIAEKFKTAKDRIFGGGN